MDRVALIAWVHDTRPVSYCLLGGAVVVVVASFTRWRGWAAIAALAVVVVGLELCRFDGKPHLTEKIDATTVLWARAAALRAMTGVVALLVAVPAGLAVAPFLGRSRAIVGSLGVFGGIGLTALVSGTTLLAAFESAAGGADGASFVATMRAAIQQSEAIIAVGTGLTVVTAALVSYRLFRAAGLAGPTAPLG